MSPTIELKVKPFLKWVGGKRSILPAIIGEMPETYNEYYEPFIGGGSVFFNTKPHNANISDLNSRLICTFRMVRDNAKDVIQELKRHKKRHSTDYFYASRKQLSHTNDEVQIAALFIYLNKTCFNGLYRVNKKDEFNVPIGAYITPEIFDTNNILAASHALQGVSILCHDFVSTPIRPRCFYYFDPPYHKTYTGYAPNGFNEEKHTALAEMCMKIDKNNGYFMLSNSNTPFIRDIFRGFNIKRIKALRSISAQGEQRGRVNELIIKNY
jgi:DNA adenine methylase